MDIIKASEKLLNVAYSCANVPLAVRSLFMSARFGDEARKIRSFKDFYPGERCYVIGNGPSFNDIDVGKLFGKKTIAVNMLYRHSCYDVLNPMFHCAIDPAMYKGEVGRDFLEVIETHRKTNYLLTAKAPEEFRTQPNAYSTILGYLPSSICSPYDLSKPSAAFVNVILVAIELAIYLGFSEIVLLGCDFSQFANRKECHSYGESGSKERSSTMFQDLQGHAIAVMQHTWLRSYAESRGAVILNATEGSYLDVYQRCKVEDVL